MAGAGTVSVRQREHVLLSSVMLNILAMPSILHMKTLQLGIWGLCKAVLYWDQEGMSCNVTFIQLFIP